MVFLSNFLPVSGNDRVKLRICNCSVTEKSRLSAQAARRHHSGNKSNHGSESYERDGVRTEHIMYYSKGSLAENMYLCEYHNVR